MAHRKTLTQAQLDVLEWISDGCPDGVTDGYDHRISAAALRKRGLVETNGRGPSWTAEVTAAGRDHLARAKEPGAPLPRQPNVSVTEQLVSDVQGAGGTLLLPIERGPGSVDYFQRVTAAHRHGKVPAGNRLKVRATQNDEWEIKLVDSPAMPNLELKPVPVPAKVSRYHPVVRTFRDQSDRHEVTKAQLERSLLLLQGLVIAAEDQGFAVENVDTGVGQRGYMPWTGPRDGHIRVTVRGHQESIRLSEIGLPSRVWWEQQNEARSRPHFLGDKERKPLPPYEAKATGKLCLDFVGFSTSERPCSWADSKSASLESRLPELLYEAEARALDAEERARQAERAAEERQQRWESAMETAKERYIRADRGRALEQDAATWRRAVQVREFCDAAEVKFGSMSDQLAEAFSDWLSWAREYADGLDPLREPPKIPDDPEYINPDDLRPFLGGLSPYGPGDSRSR